MGVYWSSPSRSRSAAGSHPAAALVTRFRLRVTLGLAALSSVGRRQVELSDHARVLAVLRGLHLDALPVPRASRFSRDVGSCSDAGATTSRLIDRAPVHDPASSVRVAAQHAARSAP